MSKTYVKLTAKPDTWFKAGTEVFWEDSGNMCRRPTKKEWDKISAERSAVFRGTRVCESVNELVAVGEEYEDGELCMVDELETELVEESLILCQL